MQTVICAEGVRTPIAVSVLKLAVLLIGAQGAHGAR